MPSTPFALRKTVRASLEAFGERRAYGRKRVRSPVFNGVCLAVTHHQRCPVRFGIHAVSDFTCHNRADGFVLIARGPVK